MRVDCLGIAFGLLLALCSIAKAASHDEFKMVPAFFVEDVELYRFASSFIVLLRIFADDWPSHDEPPKPTFFVFSEPNSIVDGEIVSPLAKKFLGEEEWDFLKSRRSTSEWCYITSAYSTVAQARQAVVFIDEKDSTERGRMNCILASIVHVYELDIQLSDYFEMPPEALALDILEEFVAKENRAK